MTENGTSLTGFMDKAFWTRSEGKFAKVILGIIGVGVAIGIGGGILFYAPILLALLQTIVTSLLTLTVTGGILFAIIALIMNDQFRNTIGFLFRSSVRWFAGAWVDLTPIAVLKDFTEELKKSLRKISKILKKISQQISDLKRLIQENQKEKEESLNLMSQAQKKGKAKFGVLQGRKAAMLSESNISLGQLLVKMEMIQRILRKMEENCDFSIQDTENSVNIKIREFVFMRTGQEAMREAMKIIKGDPNKRANFNQAMERLAVGVAEAVGEIEESVRVAADFSDGIDLEMGIFDEKSLKMLEEWEKKADSVILGPGEKQSLLNSYSEEVPFDSNVHSSGVATLPAAGIEDYFKN